MKHYQPRRIRIVQKGMEGYTGSIGPHNFTNGVSDRPIGHFEVMRISGNIPVVDARETDETALLSPTTETVRVRTISADDPQVAAFADGSALKVNPNLAADRLSLEQLEEIASKEGLSGVREIARKWGKTGRSIRECIEAVLAAQAEDDARNAKPVTSADKGDEEAEPEAAE